jgi:NAD(P)-dependent dehydrogenase (short-subunit alcohol dehydrogenase family)
MLRQNGSTKSPLVPRYHCHLRVSAKLELMAKRLKGKTGIVTGAGTGIGRACAIAMASEGAQVALVGRRKDRIEAVAHEIGDRAFALSVDVSKTGDIPHLLEQIAERFGALNFLLNNAGVLHVGNAEQITEDQWDQTFNVNVRAVWLLSRAALPLMRKARGGSIINIASTLGLVGARNRAAYAPSKGAVVQLTKSMAIDHGHENIRVNAICPSFVDTELTERILGQASDPEAVRRERTAFHPIGRLGRPEDIAGLAVYLASDESSWVTGAILPVDGGYLAV